MPSLADDYRYPSAAHEANDDANKLPYDAFLRQSRDRSVIESVGES